MVNTAKESRATIRAHPSCINEVLATSAIDPNNPTANKRTDVTRKSTQRYLAVALLLGADRIRYGTPVEEIENEFLRNKGRASTAGTYPTTAAEAYDYLCNYKKDPKIVSRLLRQGSGGEYNTDVAFVQDNGQPDDQKQQVQEQVFTTHGGPNPNLNRKKVCRRCGTDGYTQLINAVDKCNIEPNSTQPNQGISQLIHAVNWTGLGSTDAEAVNWTFLHNFDLFKSGGPVQCTEFDKNGAID
jgi:hypothetical protein